MHNQDFFVQAFIYLSAAVISVPIAKKMGLGSVLGYLLAGIVIGPFILGLVGKGDHDVMHFAEFGVVMMLFLIGLELKPSLLWKMKRSIFGLGGLQVLITAVLISVIFVLIGFSLAQSVGIGLILALSSTAIVLQTLSEKNQLKTESGNSVFSVLLFQDIAVIPILAILPLLASGNQKAAQMTQNLGDHAELSGSSGWQQLILIIGVVTAIILVGRFVSRYIFRFIAATRIREIFTAAALLMVIAIALAMNKVGLSPALGTFLAGVVLAESEYRHELESDIEPFKGLLLGLFFIAVGASIDFSLLLDYPGKVLLLLFGLITLKFLVLFVLGRLFKLRSGKDMFLAMSLAQGGEFAFVLISYSQGFSLFPEEWANLFIISVALSMALAPIMMILNEKVIQPIYENSENEQEADEIEDHDNPVLIAGFGRFGVVVGRLLIANGIKATILDNNPNNIDVLRKFGIKVYYGDASRPDLLKAAGLSKAKVLIMAIDDKEKALETTAYVQRTCPNVKIIARAVDLKHLYQYYSMNIKDVKVEIFESAIEVGLMAMRSLGVSNYQSHRAAMTFRKHNRSVLEELYQHWLEDKNHYIREVQRHAKELEETLEAEKQTSIHENDHAWDTESLRAEFKEIITNEGNNKKS